MAYHFTGTGNTPLQPSQNLELSHRLNCSPHLVRVELAYFSHDSGRHR
jgi:hypothetical protein